MGLSASQSRMLTLTARLSDLELKAQKTQEAKIRLAEQSTEASKTYMDALNAQRLKFNYYSTGSVDATVRSITESGMYRVANGLGNAFVCITEESDDLDVNGDALEVGSWYVKDAKGNLSKASDHNLEQKNFDDTEWLLEQLELSNLYIQKYDLTKDAWEDYSYSSSSLFTNEDDDTNVAKAESEYEYAMSQIQEKDKKFDLELDNINTEHEAVKTELESIKGIIKDNVSKSFTIFS